MEIDNGITEALLFILRDGTARLSDYGQPNVGNGEYDACKWHFYFYENILIGRVRKRYMNRAKIDSEIVNSTCH